MGYPRYKGPSEQTVVPALFFFFFFTHIYFPASGQAVVTDVVPSPPRFLPSLFIAHTIQQSHCSSIFHRVLLTHALALSASQFVHKKKPPRIYTSMHSGEFELTKLTYTRLEDNLIRHRGDRTISVPLFSRLGWPLVSHLRNTIWEKPGEVQIARGHRRGHLEPAGRGTVALLQPQDRINCSIGVTRRGKRI